MRGFSNRNPPRGKGNLPDTADRHEKFRLPHPETAPDQKCNLPCPRINQEIMNDSQMLIAIVQFIAADRARAAQMRIDMRAIPPGRRRTHQVLPANRRHLRSRRKARALRARQPHGDKILAIINSLHQRRIEQLTPVQARRMLRNHDIPDGPILVIEIKIENPASQPIGGAHAISV